MKNSHFMKELMDMISAKLWFFSSGHVLLCHGLRVYTVGHQKMSWWNQLFKSNIDNECYFLPDFSDLNITGSLLGNI